MNKTYNKKWIIKRDTYMYMEEKLPLSIIFNPMYSICYQFLIKS